jgi:hypothetical protein
VWIAEERKLAVCSLPTLTCELALVSRGLQLVKVRLKTARTVRVTPFTPRAACLASVNLKEMFFASTLAARAVTAR